MKRNIFTIILLLISIFGFSQSSAPKNIKYVFLFIGDGMGVNQVYLTQKFNEVNKLPDLCFLNSEWSFGLMQTECADSNKITDSGAGGTAIACGERTSYGKIGEYKGLPLQSIAEYLKNENKYRIGIITSVPLNHATPACFYGHEPTRSNYDYLTQDLLRSNFDFFAGGGFLMGNADTSKRLYKNFDQIIQDFSKGSFNFIFDHQLIDESQSTFSLPLLVVDTAIRNKQHRINSVESDEKNAFPYALDSPENADLLAKYTGFSHKMLMNDTGFFLMIEGGKIDWACHSNDALAAIYDVNAFNKAIEQALKFYRMHPDNTLILVTADHETGGLGLGTGYNDYGAAKSMSYALYVNKLKQQGQSSIFADSATLANARYQAQIGWTTNEHTSAPVGIWALGNGSQIFSGILKNSEIKEKVLSLIK